MLYRNAKTGVTMETRCIVSGPDWEPVEAVKPTTGDNESPEPATQKGKQTRRKTKEPK